MALILSRHEDHEWMLVWRCTQCGEYGKLVTPYGMASPADHLVCGQPWRCLEGSVVGPDTPPDEEDDEWPPYDLQKEDTNGE